MDRNAVLAKTAKGLEEVKSRAHGLAHKLRTMLILVDGVATVGEILAKFGGVPEIGAALDTLARDGFVEVKGLKGGAAPAPAASAPATASPAAAGPATVPHTRGEALSALTRFLHDNLGPDADLVTGRIEKAKTQAEFAAAVERCADMLGGMRGQQKAQLFRDRAKAFAAAHLGG
jgi:hypothetical protein